jgi:hypothetical protein
MAEKLDAFDFSSQKRKGRYPWDEWCNGAIWKVKSGVDYTCEAGSFKAALKAQAKERNLDLQMHEEKDAFVFQFIPSRETPEFVNRAGSVESMADPTAGMELT